jgi:ribonuclease G
LRKQLLVSVDRGETRVAILESEGSPSGGKRQQKQKQADDWRVAELYIERRGNRSIVGNVYKGKVDNVLPGLEAAFVDIGLDKNGFLHADDVVFPGVEVARRGRAGRGATKGKRITELLKPGQEILVQAIKDPLKTKGPRLSMQISIAGRYLVYVPQGDGVGVSRRLEDKERDRVRRAAQKIDMGDGGVIVRTAAQGAKREDFEREIKYLHKLHEVLQQRGKDTQAPAMVFQEADLSVRVARDIFSGEFEKALVDDQKQHHRLESFFNRTAPELLERLEHYQGKEPLFEKYGVEEAFQSVLKRRVDLPSGGYLMIDYAEAMTVIDVNSGSFTGRGKGAKLEDTITRTNVEAAEEVVRQLRLRDIGGIIVIDFIDMARARNRDTVLKTLRKSLDEDRTKTYVVEISPLGLVEMTRQNVTDGVREIMTKPCPTCEGEGVVLSEETVAIEVDRWLRDLAAERKAPAFLIRVHPKVAAILVGGHGVEGPIHEIEQETGRHFHFEGTEALAIDHFEVVLEGTADEIEERALPFREGEEVLVHIEEPHMYNDDDAVAKLDGYVVSVIGAAPLVGEKTLVRIEKVGRSAAEAVVVNPPEGVTSSRSSASAADSGTNGRRRRRGRRGGRGRRKKAESGSSSS